MFQPHSGIRQTTSITSLKVIRNKGVAWTEVATSNTPLLGSTIAINDAFYIGNASLSSSGRGFGCSVTFWMSKIFNNGTSVTLTPEYWNGAAWVTLTTRVNEFKLINPVFHTLPDDAGLVNLLFDPPANWATTTLGGGPAFLATYWIRFRVTAASGTLNTDRMVIGRFANASTFVASLSDTEVLPISIADREPINQLYGAEFVADINPNGARRIVISIAREPVIAIAPNAGTLTGTGADVAGASVTGAISRDFNDISDGRLVTCKAVSSVYEYTTDISSFGAVRGKYRAFLTMEQMTGTAGAASFEVQTRAVGNTNSAWASLGKRSTTKYTNASKFFELDFGVVDTTRVYSMTGLIPRADLIEETSSSSASNGVVFRLGVRSNAASGTYRIYALTLIPIDPLGTYCEVDLSNYDTPPRFLLGGPSSVGSLTAVAYSFVSQSSGSEGTFYATREPYGPATVVSNRNELSYIGSTLGFTVYVVPMCGGGGIRGTVSSTYLRVNRRYYGGRGAL
jgi:hypothetical protein